MQFPRALLLTLLSALAAHAAQPNPFKVPTNFSATGGQPLTLSWTPTTSGSISLVLRSGASSDLAAGTIIASSLPNSGSYVWTPSNSLTRGSDYTIEIVDDSDPSQVNYTPYFVLDTTNTVATSTPSITIGAPSSSLMMSTASPSSATGSSTSAASSSMSSAMSSGKSTVIISGTRTTSPSMATSTNSDATSTTATMGGSSTSSSPSAATTSPSTGGGVRPTIVAGMLGVVALGAFAL